MRDIRRKEECLEWGIRIKVWWGVRFGSVKLTKPTASAELATKAQQMTAAKEGKTIRFES